MSRLLSVGTCLLAVVATVAGSSVARAQQDAPTLQIGAPVSASIGETVEIVATLTAPDGSPLAGQLLELVEMLGLFDVAARDVVVASAATDQTGTAHIRYVARRDGARALTVSFRGNGQLAAVSAGFELPVASAGATYTVEAPPGIPGVNRFVLVALLAAVWGTMFIVAIHVAGIALAGRSADAARYADGEEGR